MAFIVLEGLDGAGKSTQVKKLREHFASAGTETEYLHFPRFDTPVYGELIARFLRGELGSVREVNPYLVALLYAGDRKAAAGTVRGWLEEGKTVILDRYVTSNIAYQCAKIDDPAERKALRDWIAGLEYDHHRIPRPDAVLFLDVPFGFTRQNLEKQREGADREYLRGKEDIHESSLTLQQKVRNVYLDESRYDPTVKIVECADPSGEMKDSATIFRQLLELIHLTGQ